jgi:hypothetical protein
MTDQGRSKIARKKTPEDSSEFDREQLRFFLSGADLAETLSSINPSLAWLPVLSQLELIQSDTQLIAWIERNFSEVDAMGSNCGRFIERSWRLTIRDVFNTAINAPSGRLAEILLRNLTNGSASELSDGMRARLDRLVDAPAKAGRFARIRLVADVPVLFKNAPSWTKSRIIPLFDWSSPDASDVWSSRKYSNYIGPPELFGLTKQPFLEIFGRIGVPEDDCEHAPGTEFTPQLRTHAGPPIFQGNNLRQRCEREAAGVLPVQYQQLPRLHISNEVD